MRRTALAAGICICLFAIAAHATAQTPDYPPVVVPPPNQVSIPAPSSYQMSTAPASPIAGSIDGLLAKWKTGSESDRAGVEVDLRATLKKEFQAQLADDENQAKLLEAQLKQVQERLNLRRQKQDEIIDYHLQGLLRDAQGIGWEQNAVLAIVGQPAYSSSSGVYFPPPMAPPAAQNAVPLLNP